MNGKRCRHATVANELLKKGNRRYYSAIGQASKCTHHSTDGDSKTTCPIGGSIWRYSGKNCQSEQMISETELEMIHLHNDAHSKYWQSFKR